jgi:hypothetical protein
MIEVLNLDRASEAEIAQRLARAKNIELTDAGIRRVSELARELIEAGFPVADAFNAALYHKFITEPSQKD